MNRVTGTYESGKVVLDQPVDWPDGMPVKVLCENGAQRDGVDVCFDGSPWEDSAEAIERWIAWFDSLEPMLMGDDLECFEADLRSARDEQKELSRI